MTPHPYHRPEPRKAGPELLVLAKWEEFTSWLLQATPRWPKASRFTLTQRIENHALDVTELLVEARYQPAARSKRLHEINRILERMRYLFRYAHKTRALQNQGFEFAMRGLDEAGRMLHGWRQALSQRQEAAGGQ